MKDKYIVHKILDDVKEIDFSPGTNPSSSWPLLDESFMILCLNIYLSYDLTIFLEDSNLLLMPSL